MKIQTIIAFQIILFSCGCGQKKIENKNALDNLSKLDSIFNVENFQPETSYTPISLYYKSNPLLIPGQKTEDLPDNLSYRPDPNSDYQDYFDLIIDYLSLDDNFSIELSSGSINGIIFFSADRIEKRIFNIRGHWTIDKDIDNDSINEINQAICDRLFPKLKGKIEFNDDWNYSINHQNLSEIFKLKAPVKNGGRWTLSYSVELK